MNTEARRKKWRDREYLPARKAYKQVQRRAANSALWDTFFNWESGTHKRLLDAAQVCELCGEEFDKDNRTALSPVTDHDHATNKFRGFIHDRCNRGIGSFSDRAELLEKAAVYLRRSHGR